MNIAPTTTPDALVALTMTSIELLEAVNQARALHGESEIRRNDFTARCRDELEGEYYETFVVKNPHGPASEALRMTRDQCMYVLMRESKAVRRTATECLNKPATPAFTLPDFTNPALAARAWADAIEASQALAIERDHAVATKAQIGSKREATSMATASAARKESAKLRALMGEATKNASILAVQGKTGTPYNWRDLKNYCTAAGLSMGKSFNPGLQLNVNTYPAEAWFEVYGVDLVELFGAEVQQ